MNREEQETFLHQLLMGGWDKCLSERNFLELSSWLRSRSDNEVFIKLILWDSVQGAYAIYLGCNPNGGSPIITRLFVPQDGSPDGLNTPKDIETLPLYCIPHHPIWKTEECKTPATEFDDLDKMASFMSPTGLEVRTAGALGLIARNSNLATKTETDWLIDQITRVLSGCNYDRYVKAIEDCGITWNLGIEPTSK